MKSKVNIFWFRRDLRIKDNMGLFWALKSNNPVVAVFIFDKEILKNLESNDPRVQFIHESLEKVREEVKKSGSDLHTFFNTPLEAWKEILKIYEVETVFTNEDYEPYAIKRDNSVEKILEAHKISFEKYKDHCIFAKDDVLKNDGTPYTVYTPYKNKWLEKLTPKDISTINTRKYVYNFKQDLDVKFHKLNEIGFTKDDNSKRKYPREVIKKSVIENYHLYRDIPSLGATSNLSLHLRFGTVSIRKLAQVAYELNETWLSELIWREFFMQILYHFPHVSKKSFKKKYENISWLNNKKEFKKWCDGETGFPLVDAGMRELNETGFMHNRVRMIVASFLVKDLLIDWRWGEKYFAKKLLDFELSSNNGNWQWAAGTGCDASPYFRIFNPHTQQKNFDPDLKYIKKWVPEYGTQDYPEEIVDHKLAYHRAIATYKSSIT